MRQNLIRLVFILTVIKLVLCQYNNCPPNEVLGNTINPCGTCDQRGYCPEETEETCDCVPGFFRNNQGICVPAEDCIPVPRPPPYARPPPPLPPPSYARPIPPLPPPRPRCPVNEEFTDCGTSCPPTCDVLNPVCSTECVRGCFCRRGFVRRNGQCIPFSDCPPQCPANEIFSDCGSGCPASCDNRQPICTAQCRRGCFCRPGFIRNGLTCVPIEQCPLPNLDIPPPRPRPRPTVPPAPESGGCPNRELCNRSCIRRGFSSGFCVARRFLRCTCV